MARLLLSLLCLLTAMQALAASSPTSQCPAFQTSKTMQLQSVASDISYNGIPMSIRGFSSSDDPQTVLAYYRGIWTNGGQNAPKPVEYTLGDWQVIAMMQTPCFYTVQVKANGKGSMGLLGLTSPTNGKPALKEDVPMLPGSRVANDIAHNDGGKTARTLLLKNGFSTQTNADFYIKSLGDLGWKPVSGYQGAQHDTQASTMVMRNGTREVSITITQQNGKNSTVLMNYVDQP